MKIQELIKIIERCNYTLTSVNLDSWTNRQNAKFYDSLHPYITLTLNEVGCNSFLLNLTCDFRNQHFETNYEMYDFIDTYNEMTINHIIYGLSSQMENHMRQYVPKSINI